MTPIQTERLRREFEVRTSLLRGEKKTVAALDGIDLSVDEGEMVGLLGPNGAGKTTTIKILTTLLAPTSGDARVLGLDVIADKHAIRPRIGFVFGGERGLYWRLSGKDNLVYFANLYNVSPGVQKKRIPHLLELVGLRDRGEEKVQGYSRGMKQRLHIARALLHDPDILFLDEPTLGLDPVGARRLRDAIRGLSEQRKTIMLTTHNMSEAEALCDRIYIIHHGRILEHGTPEDLKSLAGEHTVVEVEVFDCRRQGLEGMRGIPGVKGAELVMASEEQRVQIHVGKGASVIPAIVAALEQAGCSPGEIVIRQPTLEDAYVRLIAGTR